MRSNEELTAKIAIDRRGALYLCEVNEVSFVLFVCSCMTKCLYRRRSQVIVPLHLALHLLILLHIALLVGSRGPR